MIAAAGEMEADLGMPAGDMLSKEIDTPRRLARASFH
jgi:hypothetical protein